MLVLSRRVGEEIVISGTISVKVLEIRRDRIRIGVTAPDYVTVDRQEVHVLRGDFVQSALENDRRDSVLA
jgi:carbon storage regulator